MLKLPPRPCLLVAGCVAALWLSLHFAAAPARSAQAQPSAAEPLEDPAWKTKGYKYTGADDCIRCHVSQGPGNTSDLVKLTEYATWKTLDKHALAAAALRGKLGKQISHRLSGDDKNDTFVLMPEGGCLGCHSSYFPGQNAIADPLKLDEGVSCDACHGPSSVWGGKHYPKRGDDPKDLWINKTPEQKREFGLRDLRNPVERARLCSSCHIGSAEEGRVVTHAMYAAGHPPLTSFEVASFSKALPPHWYEKKDVPLFKAKHDQYKDLYKLDEPLPNTRLVLSGGVASLRQHLALVAGRASEVAAKHWPEKELPAWKNVKDARSLWPQAALAHLDCAACHHELRNPSERAERGYGVTLLDGKFVRGTPGRPAPRLWSLALAQIALQSNNTEDLNAALTKLNAACCKGRPFGDMAVVEAAAMQARDAVDLKFKFDDAKALDILKRLTTLPSERSPDFDGARQLAAAFIGVYADLDSKPAEDARIREILTDLETKLDLFAPSSLTKRYQIVAERMGDVLGKKIATEGTPEQVQETLQKAFAEMNAKQQGDLLKALLDPKHVNAMQDRRDEELATTARCAANYDPADFRKKMAELNKLVSEMKPR
jgi:hypothetical protein